MSGTNDIVRQYNYKLETGTVGTDDENIANILYNTNRMEMDASYSSSDEDELDNALGELFFTIADSKVHLKRFLDAHGSKINADTAAAVTAKFDSALAVVRGAREMEPSDTVEMSAAFGKIYKIFLDAVPGVLVLDAQAVGREG